MTKFTCQHTVIQPSCARCWDKMYVELENKYKKLLAFVKRMTKDIPVPSTLEASFSYTLKLVEDGTKVLKEIGEEK